MPRMDDGPHASRNLLRRLPAIDKWLASESGSALSAEFSAAEVAEVMRAHLARVRRGLGNGLTELPDFHSRQYAALMRAELLRQRLPSLRARDQCHGRHPAHQPGARSARGRGGGGHAGGRRGLFESGV